MYVNHGGAVYGQRNCAFCTVAAIFNTRSDVIANMLQLPQAEGAFSFAYRQKYNIPSPGPLAGINLSLDLEGVKEFVESLKAHVGSPVYVSQGGSWATLVPMNVQKRLMRSYPVGTQFAVWACTDVMPGHGAHWNYAVRTEDGVQFRDYQYDNAEGVGPRVSDDFIPPDGHDDENYNRAIVLAFTGQQAWNAMISEEL